MGMTIAWVLPLVAAVGYAAAAVIRRLRPVPVALVVDRNGKVHEVPLDDDEN